MNKKPDPKEDRAFHLALIVSAVIGAIAVIVSALIGDKIGEQQSRATPAPQTIGTRIILLTAIGHYTPLHTYTPLPASAVDTDTPAVISNPITPVPSSSVLTLTPYPTLTPDTGSPADTATPNTPQPRSQGELYLTWPVQMKTGETGVVSVELLTFTQTQTYAGTGQIKIEARTTNGERSVYQAQIDLYPIMDAELLASTFEIAESSIFTNTKRELQGQKSVAWVWNIQAKSKGEQSITVVIYGQNEPNPAQVGTIVHSVSENILVTDYKTVPEEIAEFVKNNAVALCGTGGPIGAILLILAFIKKRKDRDEDEDDSSTSKRNSEAEGSKKNGKPTKRIQKPVAPPQKK